MEVSDIVTFRFFLEHKLYGLIDQALKGQQQKEEKDFLMSRDYQEARRRSKWSRLKEPKTSDVMPG